MAFFGTTNKPRKEDRLQVEDRQPFLEALDTLFPVSEKGREDRLGFPSQAWSTYPFLFWEEWLAQTMCLIKEGFLEEQNLRLLLVCKLMITNLFVRQQVSM